MVRLAMQLTVSVWDGTYICYTKEWYEEGGSDDEEGELLSVLVEEFELIDEPRDHWFHPTHLRDGDRIGLVRDWLKKSSQIDEEVLTNIGLQGCVCVYLCAFVCVLPHSTVNAQRKQHNEEDNRPHGWTRKSCNGFWVNNKHQSSTWTRVKHREAETFS